MKNNRGRNSPPYWAQCDCYADTVRVWISASARAPPWGGESPQFIGGQGVPCPGG